MLAFDGQTLVGGDAVQFSLNGVADLIQGGVIQLLDDGHVDHAVIGLGAAAGEEGQGQQNS